MKELSVFIDESGDFGPTESHSPYYFITMVFHDQDNDIKIQIDSLDNHLEDLGLKSHYIHTGPIIRKEREYFNMPLEFRRKILSRMLQFSRNVKIKYKYFYIEKREIENTVDLIGRLSWQISNFVKEYLEFFCEYDCVKIYYDNGQTEVTKILSSVFNSFVSNVDFKLVSPSKYKLFQVADFYCTLELINLKLQENSWSKSEKVFFKNEHFFKKNYMKTIRRELFC